MSARIVVREPELLAHRVSAAILVLADDGEIGIKAVDADGIVRFYPARIAKAETDAVWLAGLPERLQRDHHRPGLRRRGREGRHRDRAGRARGGGGNDEGARMRPLIAACFDRSRVVVVGADPDRALGRRGRLGDPQGGRPRRPAADRLRLDDPRGHQRRGRRAPAGAADGARAAGPRGAQGDALDLERGPRLGAARVRGRRRHRSGPGRRAREGRPGQGRAARGDRRAGGRGGQPLPCSRCWWSRWPEPCRSARC